MIPRMTKKTPSVFRLALVERKKYTASPKLTAENRSVKRIIVEGDVAVKPTINALTPII